MSFFFGRDGHCIPRQPRRSPRAAHRLRERRLREPSPSISDAPRFAGLGPGRAIE
jgi:hypothetical protein